MYEYNRLASLTSLLFSALVIIFLSVFPFYHSSYDVGVNHSHAAAEAESGD